MSDALLERKNIEVYANNLLDEKIYSISLLKHRSSTNSNDSSIDKLILKKFYLNF